MELFPPEIRARLLASGKVRRTAAERPGDQTAWEDAMALRPIVKIFMLEPRRVWLLSDIDPVYPDIAFGLVDLGAGIPVFGSVMLHTFSNARTSLGLDIRRDPDFRADKSLHDYLVDAYLRGGLDDPTSPPCAPDLAPHTGESIHERAAHILATQESVERAAEIRQSGARLDAFLAECEREGDDET